MTKLIITILFPLISVLATAQNKNTLLLPAKLTDQQIAVVLKESGKTDKLYDPGLHLVWVNASPHYHSDILKETKMHGIKPSLKYALDLLDSRKPEFQETAFDILRAVISLQDQNPGSQTCGVWPYYLEEPLATKRSPADRNWADFCAVPLINIIINHKELLPDDLKEKTRNALLLAARAIKIRDVHPDYTNISLMGLYVCYITADMYNNADLMTYARQRLKAFYDCTLLNKGFIEYNSPSYFKLSLDEVLRLKERVINKDDHAMLDSIYNTGWNIIARHYHQPSAQWSGPHGRCYTPLLSSETYNWLYDASDGKISPDTPTPYSKDKSPVLNHRIPEYLIRYFTNPAFPRMEIDTFIHGSQNIELNPLVSYQESDRGVKIVTKEIIGKSYLTKDFVLSSASQSCLWNQRRPLIAYWGDEKKPVYMQVRFLHNLYDYAAANIFCSQDSTSVLGAINFTTNGGDRHVTIDVIRNATIKATDLRLRFEFGGDISSITFNAPDIQRHSVSGKSGKIHFKIALPYVKFNGYKGSWSTGGDDKTKWIDFVIYNGPELEFNFEKIDEAVIGFLLSVKTFEAKSNKSVKFSKTDGFLNLGWGNLQIKAALKPYYERATLILK